MKIGKHEVEISSRDKILFPDAGITKGELVDYYQRIAEVMLPHLKDRPVSLQRFPSGIQAQGFYQKEVPDYFPDWVGRAPVEVKGEEEVQDQVVIDNAAALVYLANQNTITFHAWLSRVGRLDHPDRLIFDLDPPEENFALVQSAARLMRAALGELGLEPFLMTTGGRGLHVTVPLDRSADFDTVRDFARDVCDYVASKDPERLTTEQRKDARSGRLFLDYMRNAYAQTGVAPYSVRAKPGATVAAPLDWDELKRKDLHSGFYTLRNIFKRLDRKSDPWADISSQARSLKAARRQLDQLFPAGKS